MQKVVDTRAVFKDVIAGKLCNFSVRTEKEFFRDSPAVIITIRAGKHTITQAQLLTLPFKSLGKSGNHNFLFNPVIFPGVLWTLLELPCVCFLAPSTVTLLPLQRTSASLSVRWRAGQGVSDSFILSIRNSTFILQTNQSASDDRCGFRSVICPKDSFFMWERFGLQLSLFLEHIALTTCCLEVCILLKWAVLVETGEVYLLLQLLTHVSVTTLIYWYKT